MLWHSLTAALLTAAPASSQNIERLVITAGPPPASWLQAPAALNQRQFDEQTGVADPAALLQGIAGLQADVRANFAQDSRLSLRGFGSRSAFGVRGLRMLLDGIPLTTPDGQTQPGSLMTEDLAAVEVLKGPFAALYGNAAGAVIHWQSRQSSPGRLQLKQQQSQEFSQQSLSLDTDAGNFALQRWRHQGYRPHNRAEREQALWRHSWQFDDAFLRLRFEHSADARLDDPGGLSLSEWQQNPFQTQVAASQFDSHKSTRHQQLSASWQQQHWQLSSWLGQRAITQFLAMRGDGPTASGGIVQLERQSAGLQMTAQHQWQDLQLHLGASHEQSRDDRQGFVNNNGLTGALRRDERGSTHSQDLSLRLSYPLSETLDLFAGSRLARLKFEVHDHFVTPLNPNDSGQKTEYGQAHAAGFRYALTPNLWWHGSVGRGFETPTLTEMAYQRDGAGLNLALRSTRNQQWDSGLKWQSADHRRQTQLDVFRLSSQDELVIDSSSGGRTTYRNAAATHRRGLELSLQQGLADDWQLDYSLTWLDARFSGEDAGLSGLQLPGIAKWQQQLRVSYQPDAHWSATLQHNRLSRVATNDRNTEFAPAAALTDAQLNWHWQHNALHWSFLLKAQNLTDERYAGTVIVNQAAGRSIEPGMPRQLSAGLQMQIQLW